MDTAEGVSLSACLGARQQQPVGLLGASAARTVEHPENRRRTPAGGRRPAKENNRNSIDICPVYWLM